MTKQEEIGGGIEATLTRRLFAGIPEQAKAIIGYLHSQGVVIKVGFDGTSKNRVFTTVEPLIIE